MLKGSRAGILKKVQPLSIHGQISWDVFFIDADDEDGPVQMARVGPEAVDRKLEPGDRITLQYLLGSVIRVTRTPTERKEPVQA
jgi:hypothetical protein